MAVTNDWVRLAAAQIRTEIHEFCVQDPTLAPHAATLFKNLHETRMAAIIQQYCPFEKDVAYMPVNLGPMAQIIKGVEELLRVCQFVSNARLAEINPALRDAVVGLRVVMEQNSVVLQCTGCGLRTIPLEAATRNHHRGACSSCGGSFVVTLG